jgi:RecJ-like exonuclease
MICPDCSGNGYRTEPTHEVRQCARCDSQGEVVMEGLFSNGVKAENKVNRWTRAGEQGREIYCPHCDSETRVYNFSWSRISCSGCRKDVEKTDWYTP